MEFVQPKNTVLKKSSNLALRQASITAAYVNSWGNYLLPHILIRRRMCHQSISLMNFVEAAIWYSWCWDLHIQSDIWTTQAVVWSRLHYRTGIGGVSWWNGPLLNAFSVFGLINKTQILNLHSNILFCSYEKQLIFKSRIFCTHWPVEIL